MTLCRLATKAMLVALVPACACGADQSTNDADSASDAMVGNEAGQVRDDNSLKLKLVWCPPGLFTMEGESFRAIDRNDPDGDDADEDGANERKKARLQLVSAPVKVFLSHGYWVGKYEVTQSQWRKVMGTRPWQAEDGVEVGDEFPATFINWTDAMSFCEKLTQRERRDGRLPPNWEYSLPSEAQWERACRARTETAYCFGDDEKNLGEFAWFLDNIRDLKGHSAQRVGQKKGNAWGLCDMHGNAWEWCRDVYQENLPGGRDPLARKSDYRRESYRAIRGGCWDFLAFRCRSGMRDGESHARRNHYTGFRIACVPVQ